MVAPGVVGMLIWQNIFEPSTGLFAKLMEAIGILPKGTVVDFLNDPDWVIPTIIILGFPWVNGTNILIYISGMMNISGEVIEASELDGCGTWRRIFAIDLPLLLGQIRYFLVFGFIGLMQDYGIQMILTNGGPGYSTYVPGWYMYRLAFTSGRLRLFYRDSSVYCHFCGHAYCIQTYALWAVCKKDGGMTIWRQHQNFLQRPIGKITAKK